MPNLKTIAKQWKTITFNQFKAIYNNLKIVYPQDVVKLLGITISNNEILIMATKKQQNPTITLADLMKEIKSIKSDIVAIKTKLNSHEQLFKQHGWMK